ncbi:MAG: hypothetical protein MUC60_05190 [Oscillatoria sp. Prado101]|nr:hypothetical protein [Oscillatoria sp. Prado101]
MATVTYYTLTSPDWEIEPVGRERPTTNFWAKALLRTFWAEAQLRTFGLKPNYELLG